jgi:hypothetical protein
MNNIEYLCSYSTTVDTEMHSEKYCLYGLISNSQKYTNISEEPTAPKFRVECLVGSFIGVFVIGTASCPDNCQV